MLYTRSKVYLEKYWKETRNQINNYVLSGWEMSIFLSDFFEFFKDYYNAEHNIQ